MNKALYLGCEGGGIKGDRDDAMPGSQKEGGDKGVTLQKGRGG